MPGEPRRHRGRAAQRPVGAAEVVVRDVEGDAGREVFELLAEPQREPRKAAQERADRQVRAFYVGCTYRVHGEPAEYDAALGVLQDGRAVAPRLVGLAERL